MRISGLMMAAHRQGQAAYPLPCLAYIDEIEPKLLTWI